METIKIKVQDREKGLRSVEAQKVSEDIAVHKALKGSGYSITHIPTGYQISDANKIKITEYLAKLISSNVTKDIASTDVSIIQQAFGRKLLEVMSFISRNCYSLRLKDINGKNLDTLYSEFINSEA